MAAPLGGQGTGDKSPVTLGWARLWSTNTPLVQIGGDAGWGGNETLFFAQLFSSFPWIRIGLFLVLSFGSFRLGSFIGLDAEAFFLKPSLPWPRATRENRPVVCCLLFLFGGCIG